MKIHNSPLDVTFVYNDRRVIYNADALYSGSPATAFQQPYNGPVGNICGYELAFPGDDRFLGSTDAVLDWPTRDNSGQREQVAYWMAEQLGLRSNYRHFVRVYVNGVASEPRGLAGGHGTRVYEDTQQPNSASVSEWFPGNDEGELHKLDQWVEFSPASDYYSGTNAIDPRFEVYASTNNARKLARYRWIYPKRGGGAQAHNYANLYTLVDALNTNNSYTATVNAVLDSDQWLRVCAFEAVVGNGDAFGNAVSGKNMFMYRPVGGLWQLLLWDLDTGLGEDNSKAATNRAPFGTTIQDPIALRLITNAPFQRIYWRTIKEAVDGPMQSANYGPIVNAHYSALTGNGVHVKAPNDTSDTDNCALTAWIDMRRTYLTGQLATVAASFAITNNGGNNITVTNKSNYMLGGTAPVEVYSVRINSATNALLSWPTVTDWMATVGLTNGANPFNLQGYDRFGNQVPNAFDSITITSR